MRRLALPLTRRRLVLLASVFVPHASETPQRAFRHSLKKPSSERECKCFIFVIRVVKTPRAERRVLPASCPGGP
jgi:hypothetical protein